MNFHFTCINFFQFLFYSSFTFFPRFTYLLLNFQDGKIISNLITTLESYGFQEGENFKNTTNTTTVFRNLSNVQTYVKYIKPNGNLSMEEKLFTFQDASFVLSQDALPPSVDATGAVVVVFLYRTIHSFLKNSFRTRGGFGKINSKIFTVSVRPEPKEQFSEPVRLIWNTTEKVRKKLFSTEI